MLAQPQLFAGVAFDGAVIRSDTACTAMFLKSPTDMKLAEGLRIKLDEMSREKLPPAGVRVPGPVRP